jgi:hypothetical protein
MLATPGRVLAVPPWAAQALEPVQLTFDLTPSSTELSPETPITLAQYTVPAGRLLAIEFASAFASTAATEKVLISIETSVGATTATYYLPLAIIFDSSDLGYRHSGSEAMRIYADQGTTVLVKGTILSACTDELCAAIDYLRGSVSGHLLRLK